MTRVVQSQFVCNGAGQPNGIAGPIDQDLMPIPDHRRHATSPRDRTREKLDCYAAVGTRMLMIIDRDPWSVDLYRLSDSKPKLVGRIEVDSRATIETESIPLRWRLIAGPERPLLQAKKSSTVRTRGWRRAVGSESRSIGIAECARPLPEFVLLLARDDSQSRRSDQVVA
jgi:hypothetical protein